MTPRRCMLGVGILLLFLGVTPLAKVIEAQQKDWYWTHQDMTLPLSAVKNNAEIFIDNHRIDDVLLDKDIFIKREGRIEPLDAESITFRLNKKYEMIFYDAIFAAFFIASGVTSIICSFFVINGKVINGVR